MKELGVPFTASTQKKIKENEEDIDKSDIEDETKDDVDSEKGEDE